jgi:hypothetical protein
MCNLTAPLTGRPRPHFRTGPHTQCHDAHGAATMIHGPLQLLLDTTFHDQWQHEVEVTATAAFDCDLSLFDLLQHVGSDVK